MKKEMALFISCAYDMPPEIREDYYKEWDVRIYNDTSLEFDVNDLEEFPDSVTFNWIKSNCDLTGIQRIVIDSMW